LAKRLVDISQQVISDEATLPADSTPPEPPGSDEEPGSLDVLVIAEEAMPQLIATIGQIAPEIQAVGDLTQKAATDITQGKGFAARLAVARRLAQKLSAPADRVVELANRYTKSLYEIDAGIRTIIAHAPTELRNNPSAKSQWAIFANAITQLATITRQAMDAIKGMTESISQGEGISRDLRPPLQKLRQGLTVLAEGSSVINEWETLVNEILVE
jgi:hypothetical protein